MLQALFRAKPKRKAAEKRAAHLKVRPLKVSHALLAIEGKPVAVNVRLNPRARRIVMRVNPGNGEVCVTAPARAGLDKALAFARGEAAWIARQRAQLAPACPLAVGETVPFLGMPHLIRPGAARAPVWRDEAQGVIFVSGRAEHGPRRLTDFFKREARRLFETRALELSAVLGVSPSRIAVRDTASRWGSCSQARTLSFCWRLVFAPEFVRDYVVAHEVAHLKEMNHSVRFWTHVARLSPDAKRARKWLRDNGRGLLRYN